MFFASAGLSLAMPAVCAPAAAAANHVAADFSVARNPNGNWSYLTGATRLAFVQKTCDQIGLRCRWNGKPICNSVLVGASATHAPLSWLTIRLPADHVLMDPESAANVIVRWTAPAAASYEISGDFLGADVSETAHPVAVLDNGATLVSGTINSYGQKVPFYLTRTLARGESVDFVVSTGSACSYLGTGLKATIAPAPAAALPH